MAHTILGIVVGTFFPSLHIIRFIPYFCPLFDETDFNAYSTGMQINITRNISKLVLLFFIVSYFKLFQLSFISSTIGYLAQIISGGLLISFLIIGIIYLPFRHIQMHFSTPIIILIISSIPSIFMAKYFHQQSILISAFAYRLLVFYLIYFYVHIYKIPVQFIIKSIVGVGLLAVVLYYLQLIVFPKMIMNIYYIEGRGTLRLFVPGMICTQAAYFFFLYQFFNKKKFYYLLLSFVSLSIFVLQGTRQMIFALVFLSMVYILFSKKVRSKLLISLIFLSAIVALFFAFQNIFYELTLISSSQSKNLSGGIRLKTMNFFLTDFMPNNWAYFFGNGESGPGSLYSQRLAFLSLKYGFYLSDIGLIGDYIKYGIIFMLAGVVMIVNSIRFRVSPEYSYLKYYIFSQCFTFITGTGIFGGVDIVILCILYIFDIDRAKNIRNINVPVNK